MRRTLVLVLLVMLLGACSDGGDDDEAATTTSTTATTTLGISITATSGLIAQNVDDARCLLGARYEIRDGEGDVLATGEIDEAAQVMSPAPDYACLQLEDLEVPAADFYDVRLTGDGWEDSRTVSADEVDAGGALIFEVS